MQIYNSNSCSNAFFYAEDKNVALRWKFSCVGAGGAAAAEAKPQILRQGFKYPYFDIFAPVIDPQKLIESTAKTKQNKTKPQLIHRNRPF